MFLTIVNKRKLGELIKINEKKYRLNTESVYGNAIYLGNKKHPYLLLSEAINKQIEICDIHADTLVVGKAAFHNCSKLKKVTISEKVIRLEEWCFSGCESLSVIHFKSIEMEDLRFASFAYSGAQNGVELIVGNKVKRIPANMFGSFLYGDSYCGMFSKIEACNICKITFEEPSMCEEIGDGAF